MKFNFTDYVNNRLDEDKDLGLDDEPEKDVYQTKHLELANIDKLAFSDSKIVVIDGVKYKKDVRKDDLPCVLTKKGQLKLMIDLYDVENHKSKILVYSPLKPSSKKFTVENKF